MKGCPTHARGTSDDDQLLARQRESFNVYLSSGRMMGVRVRSPERTVASIAKAHRHGRRVGWSTGSGMLLPPQLLRDAKRAVL